jgi:hypothetical protein
MAIKRSDAKKIRRRGVMRRVFRRMPEGRSM